MLQIILIKREYSKVAHDKLHVMILNRKQKNYKKTQVNRESDGLNTAKVTYKKYAVLREKYISINNFHSLIKL